MRALVCPTAFKESLSASRVADALAAGVRAARPDAVVRVLPVSDGGPGLIEAIQRVHGGEVRVVEVRGPLVGVVPARSLWLPDGEVVVEAADACGLHLVPPAARDPLRASTRGVGELVRWCLAQGAASLRIGLGGSATVDVGTGMATALGFRFLDASGTVLPAGGGALVRLSRIVPPRAPFDGPGTAGSAAPPEVIAIADVRSPLLGADGAARRFAPQKGATPGQVEVLEAGLATLAERVRLDLAFGPAGDVADLPGAGAAGGLGAGCAAFLGATIVPGSEWVLDGIGFDEALGDADLVVTGEAEYDATSGLGKVVWEIVRRAGRAGVPVVLTCARFRGNALPGVIVAEGDGRWLEPSDLSRMVADALS